MDNTIAGTGGKACKAKKRRTKWPKRKSIEEERGEK